MFVLSAVLYSYVRVFCGGEVGFVIVGSGGRCRREVEKWILVMVSF